MPPWQNADLAPCGTAAAARRHYRHGEPLDEACLQASRRELGSRRGIDAGKDSPDRRDRRNGLPGFRPYVWRAPRRPQLLAALAAAEAEHGPPQHTCYCGAPVSFEVTFPTGGRGSAARPVCRACGRVQEGAQGWVA